MDVDLGFIILCPDRNTGGVKNTCGSIRHHSYNRDVICIVGSDATKKEIEEMNEMCPTYKGKDTITSLVNKGFYHLKHEWGLLLFAGSRIQPFLERKISTFINSTQDILYPIDINHLDFVSTSFNGVIINKNFFKEVGKFPESKMEKDNMNDFEFVKMLWAVDALEKGAKLKGILGIKII